MFEHASASVDTSALHLLVQLLLALSRLGVTHPSASVVAGPSSSSSSVAPDKKERPMREYSDSHGDDDDLFPFAVRRRLAGGAFRSEAAAASRRRPCDCECECDVGSRVRSGVLVTENGTCVVGTGAAAAGAAGGAAAAAAVGVKEHRRVGVDDVDADEVISAV